MEPIDVTTPYRAVRANVRDRIADMLTNHPVGSQGRELPATENKSATEGAAAYVVAEPEPAVPALKPNPAQGSSGSPAPAPAMGATSFERIRALADRSGIADPFTDPTLQH